MANQEWQRISTDSIKQQLRNMDFGPTCIERICGQWVERKTTHTYQIADCTGELFQFNEAVDYLYDTQE